MASLHTLIGGGEHTLRKAGLTVVEIVKSINDCFSTNKERKKAIVNLLKQ